MEIILYFPPEYLKAALVVSLLSVWVLIGLFYYLNRYTKRRYFSYWTIGWLFYAIWLSLCIGLQFAPHRPPLILLKQSCLGCSAVFLIWGSARFLHQRTKPSHLALFLVFLFVWSYVAAYRVTDRLQAEMPLFSLVGLASLLTAGCFYRFGKVEPHLGTGLLAAGFGLWGLYMAAHPIFEASRFMISAGFIISAVIQLFIAVSMIILVLEEVRYTNHRAFQRIRQYKSKADFLQKKVTSTEERYRSLFDQASEGIVIADADELRIVELNQTARRLLGVNNGEAMHSPLSGYCQLRTSTQPLPQTGREWFAAICRDRNISLVRRDGGMTSTEVDGALISFEGRPAFQFFLRELTERTRLEQQLRQAEKLSALGQMISGVAHELNNPLAVIKGYLELVMRRADLDKQTRADLEKVAYESNRAAKLVSNFLSFAREQPAQRERVVLNDVVCHATELRKLDFQNSRVDLVLQLEPGLPATHADPDQLQQVLMNLLNNALHAVSGTSRPSLIRITTESKDNSIQLLVEDNGPGVSAEILPYIFEPFFTTKEVGAGTGLGLSIAHSIMADHNGRIAYQSASIGGAGFVLEFPLAASSPDAEKADPETASPGGCDERPGTRTARILVLDDELAIGELLGEMLGMIGHSATLCKSGSEALEILEKQHFDVIISDFRMPRMNGKEFFERAVERHPELAHRIIFLTGDVVNEDTQAFLRTTGNPHLSKPFQLAQVERAVNEVLLQTTGTGLARN